MTTHRSTATPKHLPLASAPSPLCLQCPSVRAGRRSAVYRPCIGTLPWDTPGQDAAEKGLLTDRMQLPRRPQASAQLQGLPSPRPSERTEPWLYPSNARPFFRRKESIDIDLKASNLINCQLSLQGMYFMDGVNV